MIRAHVIAEVPNTLEQFCPYSKAPIICGGVLHYDGYAVAQFELHRLVVASVSVCDSEPAFVHVTVFCDGDEAQDLKRMLGQWRREWKVSILSDRGYAGARRTKPGKQIKVEVHGPTRISDVSAAGMGIRVWTRR